MLFVTGGVNFGMENPLVKEATEASMFLVNGVNIRCRIPVGYFFIMFLTGEQLANLVRICAGKLNEINVTVISLTTDGSASHVAMARGLGAKFSDRCINSYISEEQFLVWILDTSHMDKLVRNTWGDYEIYKFEDKQICWSFVKRLWELQTSRSLHLRNKLTKKNIEYQQNKMKTEYATQLFKSSVADSIHIIMINSRDWRKQQNLFE